MIAVNVSTHTRAAVAVDSYDIDALNWAGVSMASFDDKVLSAAQAIIESCSPEEWDELTHVGRQTMSYFNVLMMLNIRDEPPAHVEAIAALIVGMYRVVML